MSDKSTTMFYGSAALAILATVGYHFFVKKIPANINPMVSVIGIYMVVLILALVLSPFLIPKGEFLENVQRLSWVQVALGVIVMGMELGFLLMYRHGWDLSLGNVVTGVFINVALVAIGLLFLREHLSVINITGIVMCIIGVAMIGYKSPQGVETPGAESSSVPALPSTPLHAERVK